MSEILDRFKYELHEYTCTKLLDDTLKLYGFDKWGILDITHYILSYTNKELSKSNLFTKLKKDNPNFEATPLNLSKCVIFEYEIELNVLLRLSEYKQINPFKDSNDESMKEINEFRKRLIEKLNKIPEHDMQLILTLNNSRYNTKKERVKYYGYNIDELELMD